MMRGEEEIILVREGWMLQSVKGEVPLVVK
jgi:hypothetical protein